jgi:glyoxylase-like metal-dependent hydrolase (beta-lactamase superfamily II)
MIARLVGMASATAAIRDLGDGVRQFQAPLWQTNSLLAVSGSEALLCDPALAPDEIAAIRAEVDGAGGGPLHLLVTHGDFDHVCGIPYFPEAQVSAGEEAARRIREDAAGELADSGPEWGYEWHTDGLRVDRVVAAGEFRRGAFRVEALEAPSHGREGLAFVLPDQGILCAGDHLSPITYPLLAGSLERTALAVEGLLGALERFELRWVVPGHGRALEPEEAQTIGEADLAYLRELQQAAREAAKEEAGDGWALLRAFEVEPPRANTDDFEIYGIRAANARLAVAEARAGG